MRAYDDETGKRKTQLEIVRDQLLTYGTVDAHDMLLHYGITRCAAIIFKLREEGIPIETTNKPGHMATYRLTARAARYEQTALGLVP